MVAAVAEPRLESADCSRDRAGQVLWTALPLAPDKSTLPHQRSDTGDVRPAPERQGAGQAEVCCGLIAAVGRRVAVPEGRELVTVAGCHGPVEQLGVGCDRRPGRP